MMPKKRQFIKQDKKGKMIKFNGKLTLKLLQVVSCLSLFVQKKSSMKLTKRFTNWNLPFNRTEMAYNKLTNLVH
jgi:hypothetical protein